MCLLCNNVLRSDNGRAFVNSILEEVVATWPGQVQLVSGRPRHPQSQGLVEGAHHTLERMLAAKIEEENSKEPQRTTVGSLASSYCL